MLLKDLEKTWDILAKHNAPYFILSKFKKWNESDFYKTGFEEIGKIIPYLKKLGVNFGGALDFGCGIGRLTQPLSFHFKEVVGIDISKVMIDKAIAHNKYKNCKFAQANTLATQNNNSYDFIYSNIVLQHMRPEYSKEYIKEFFRISKSNGYIIFQLPFQNNGWENTKIYPRMEMYSVSKEEVLSLLNNDIELIEILEDCSTGPEFLSCKYVFHKK